MNLNELFFNPVSIIATVLAAFFVAMAVLRRSSSRQNARARSVPPDSKPYRVSDPYSVAPPTAPAPAAPPPAVFANPSPSAAAPEPERKFFRQYDGTERKTDGSAGDSSGYVWE